MNQEVDSRLKSLSVEFDVEEDELLERYEAALDEVEERALVELPEEKKREFAFSIVRSDVIETQAVGGGSEIDVLAVGHDSIQQWVDSDDPNYDENAPREDNPKKDVLVANGVIETDDGLGLSSFILDETDGVDLGKAKEAFEPLSAFRGTFSYKESENMQRAYVTNSTADTDFELEAAENIPDDRQERLNILHKFVDEVDFSNILDNLSLTTPSNSGGEWPADFGVDLKRIEGSVVDYYVAEDGSSSSYTILDNDSVPSEVEGTAIAGEQQRTTGLTCWTPKEFMQYGNGSKCEFYGTLTQGDEGRIMMNVRGVVPLMPRPIQDAEAAENVERETI